MLIVRKRRGGGRGSVDKRVQNVYVLTERKILSYSKVLRAFCRVRVPFIVVPLRRYFAVGKGTVPALSHNFGFKTPIKYPWIDVEFGTWLLYHFRVAFG